MYAGVDGCREGWVAVVLPQERVIEGFTHFRPLADHLVQSGVEVIGVDMPLSAPVTGQRACDLLARQALGPFRSSLFITPTAAALAAPTQREATRINRARGGTGVSSQSFSLRHKVAEVSAHEGPLIEVHPELSFHLLGPVEFRKRSWAGLRERVDVLQRLGLHPLQWESGGWAAADDTLDAAVAAVSARRYARGEAEGFGDHEGMIWA